MVCLTFFKEEKEALAEEKLCFIQPPYPLSRKSMEVKLKSKRPRILPKTSITVIEEPLSTQTCTTQEKNTILPILMPLPAMRLSTVGSSSEAIMARSLMCEHIIRAYSRLVDNGTFCQTNICPDCNSTSFLAHPIEDPLGVLAAATSVIRHAYKGDSAAKELQSGSHFNLSKDARHFMAAALFISYKAKTEDTWRASANIPKLVLTPFITAGDYCDKVSNARLAKYLTEAEVLLLCELPIHTLIEFNAHSVVEVHLWELVARGVIGKTCAFAALSACGIMLNQIVSLSKKDLLSELQSAYPMHVVANGLLRASLGCVATSNEVDKADLPTPDTLSFSKSALFIAESLLNSLCKSSTGARALSCIQSELDVLEWSRRQIPE